MKVALVYDRVNTIGGAERVLLALHTLFPSAPLYTSVYAPSHAGWAGVFSIHTSFLQKLPFARTHHQMFPLVMPLVFESFQFDSYDLVVSVTSEAAKGVLTRGKTKHICYCLTPTRYLWSGYTSYVQQRWMQLVTKPAIRYLQQWDVAAASRPDVMVAISQEVQKRIYRYYHRRAQIVYPPLFLHDAKPRTTLMYEHPFFLIVSRLVPYKKIDLAIRACNRLRVPLRIIGTGTELQKLSRIAGPTVKFLGSLTDQEVIAYYKSCRGLIFPGNEDFGLTIVEAQHYGKPVLAYRAGGALETIVENKTGLFFEKQTVDSLIKGLDKFMHFRYNEKDCLRQAAKFNVHTFQSEFMRIVEKTMQEAKTL